MILTSVCEKSEFCGKSDYDLNHVRTFVCPARVSICALLASSRSHQSDPAALAAGLGLFWRRSENGGPLGRKRWISASHALVDGENHARRRPNPGLGFPIGHAHRHLATLGCLAVYGNRRSGRRLFVRGVRVVVSHPDQGLQPNDMSLGLASFWRSHSLCLALGFFTKRWRRRTLLSRGPCLHRICFHGRLLWAEAKWCANCKDMVGPCRVTWFCVGHFTTSTRRPLHEPHPVDGLALLDGGLAEPPHLRHHTASKKSSPNDLSRGACYLFLGP